MRKVKKRKIWAILGAFVIAIACVFSCILPSTVKKETASADSGIVYSDTSNLIYMEDAFLAVNGVTFRITEGNRIQITGTSSRANEFVIPLVDPLNSGTYSFNLFGEWNNEEALCFLQKTPGDYTNRIRLGGKNSVATPFTISYSVGNMQLYCAPGQTYNIDCYLMVNRGSVAYPYSQNPHYVYDQGYDAAKTEFWRGVDFSVKAKINGSYIRDYITPNYVDYGVDLSCFYDFYTSTYAGATISDITVSLDFPNVLCDNLEIMTTRDLSTWKWSMTDDYHIHNVSAVCDSTDLSFEGQALYFMYPAIYDSEYDVSGDLCLSTISGSISSIDDFKGLVFIENSGFYEGYKQGYTDGGNDAGLYDKGYDTGYGNGYSVGYSEGAGSTNSEKYDAGYNKGYSVGFTEGKLSVDPDSLSNSIRTFIFSLFDAPFAVIEPFIELDVLGIDLGGIFSLILLVGLVSFVFKVI